MSFKADLEDAKSAEVFIMNLITQRYNPKHIRPIGFKLKGIKKRNLERIAGDIRLLTNDNKIHRIEVKRDKSAYRTGNLFLERYSDNGERTGRTTVGWFDNKDCKVTHYAFVLVNKGTLIIKRRELKALVNKVKPRVISMKYNQTQMNRSDGYLLNIDLAITQCESALFLKDVYV